MPGSRQSMLRSAMTWLRPAPRDRRVDQLCNSDLPSQESLRTDHRQPTQGECNGPPVLPTWSSLICTSFCMQYRNRVCACEARRLREW